MLEEAVCDEAVEFEVVEFELAEFGMGRGTALRGFLRLSNVTPLPNFVIPTTGGSPFFTNSHSPTNFKSAYHSVIPNENIGHTRQFVSSQSECFPSHFFVQVTLQFKNNPTDRNSCRPVVEFSLSFTHSHLISFRIDADVGADSRIQLVVHSS